MNEPINKNKKKYIKNKEKRKLEKIQRFCH